MIDLEVYKKDRTIRLAGGVTITAKALPLRRMNELRERAAAQIEGGIDGRQMVEEAGGEVFDIPDPANDQEIRALTTTQFTLDLAAETWMSWVGVVADGAPLDLTPANVLDFLNWVPGAAQAFLLQYTNVYADIGEEGNDFGAGHDGISDPAPDNAGNAASENDLAPAAD